MSDPNEGQVSNKETTNVAEENEEEEKKFDDINVTTATTSVAASMTTASTMMPMTGWIDNNNNNHHYEDDGHTWSRSQPASPSSSRLGDYYHDEPVAKKGKRDVYRNSKLNNNGTTTATTTTTSSSSFLRSPPRPHLFGGGAAAGSSQSSQVLSPSLSAMSASTGTTEKVTNTSSVHHSLCLSPSVSATVSATAGTTGPTGGTGSAAATSPSSTTTMMMTTTSFSEPPSGWEAIWERFMTTNDQSRQLLRQWVSLPTIAVLGDTSSGKSSLLSQLSGLVELPSSHELTTKCPTELQMRYSSNRQATIDIHWDRQQQQIMTTTTTTTTPSQQQQRNNNNTNLRRARKLLWEQRVLRTPEEWKQIPNILLQAQQVILKEQERNDLQSQQHPSVERDNNRSNHNNKNNNKNTTTAASQPTVASDIISIVLTGPMYPKQQTLTLVDLPGLVQGRHNAMTESSAVSNDILNLLHPYLTNPHCLLLTVLPANVDYHNAHALKLASQHDPDCRRTCIVWTKPDLIDPGAESTVVEWIQQAPRVFNCRHVHMVKCRGQKAASMNESLQACLEDEQHYFATTLPWKDMDASYLGTIQLRQKLCHLQAQLVQQYMPQVLTELKMQHDQTLKQLQDLGGHRPLETAAERRQYYQITCQRLVSHLQTSLSGKGSESSKPATSSLATTTLPSFFSSSLSLHSTPSSNSSGGGGSGIGGPNSIANQQFVPPPPPPPPPPRKVMATSWTNSSSSPPSFVVPHPSTTSNTNSLGDETNSNNNNTTVAASRLHEACGVFTNQIKQGSLATVRTIVEGAQVLVTSAQGTVRGEVVHLDEDAGYCCVDSYHNHTNNTIMDDCTRRILFEFTGQVLDQQQPRRRRQQQQGGRRRRNSGASASSLNHNDDGDDDDDDDDQTPRMEENDVWSDGKRVLIARAGGHSYDALRKIPLDCVWTDPTSWLQSQISQFRTDDLPCFLNVESFAHIVQQFMHHDWAPACYTLLDECKTILQSAMSQALEKAIHCSSTSMTTATTRTTTTATTSNATNTMFWNNPDEPPPRYPGLRQLLHRHLRHVAESLLNDATLQVESHLAMEAHPFTQDDALFAQMNQARYSRLKRELEVALLAELEQPATTGAVDAGSPYRAGVEPTHSAVMNASDVSTTNGTRDNLRTAVTNNNMEALPGILDNVFARHENLSMNEHLAFEMELALESYGVIATRRVLDRTPMICWHVYRTFASLLSTQLASVTDADLTAALTEKPELAEQFQTLQDKCDKLKESIQLLENF